MDTLEDLKARLKEFCDARDWNRFHKPKDLALALSIECGELSEHFLWKDLEESTSYLNDEKARKEVLEEIADILIYSLNFVNTIERLVSQEIDITSIMVEKIKDNARKYPAELYKSKARLEKYKK
ncbi:MAG: nucleotide pyrophosphohydrolase [Candidatus Hodarchaeota archaeon]